ncbi:MAG TPA: DoxX family protein [Ktedonobacterales bacterium]|nr:DoxX family protein [Ktedonobacterales bacterium]
MSIPHIAALALEALLGALMACAAYTLFAWKPASLAKLRDALHYPRWYWVLAGITATIGAIGLLVGLAIPLVAVAAIIWMVAYYIVASFTHLIRKDMMGFSAPLLFLAICAGLLALRWSDATPILAFIGL